MNPDPLPSDPFSAEPAPSPAAHNSNPDVLPPAGLPPGSGVGAIFDALLKRPGAAIHELTGGPGHGKATALLTLATVGCLAVFGLVLGSFSGGTQLWAAPLKLAGGLLAAGLMCLPSLYVFCCLGGMNIRASRIAGLMAGVIALTSVLLVAFAPVVWVFSQSTGSEVFLGGLVLVVWLVSLAFGFLVLKRGARALGMTDTFHLRLWCVIFLFVTLQMSTALRPIIGTAPTVLPEKKRFFLQHWKECLNAPPSQQSADTPPGPVEKPAENPKAAPAP